MDKKDIRFEILRTRNKLKRTTRRSWGNQIKRDRLQNNIDRLEGMLKEGV